MLNLSPITRASIQFIATVALAIASAAALASEATQLVVPASVLSRAEVKAEIVRSRSDVAVKQLGDATVFADLIAAPRSRDAVRAEARQAAHERLADTPYGGA